MTLVNQMFQVQMTQNTVGQKPMLIAIYSFGFIYTRWGLIRIGFYCFYNIFVFMNCSCSGPNGRL
jgi:hypothetical protein